MRLVTYILMAVAVVGGLSTKLMAASFTHLVPEDTVYYVEGSLSDLNTVLGYQATDLLIQVNKAGLSQEGIEERNKQPMLSYAYDMSVMLANYLHDSYAKQSPKKPIKGRYAFYLDGLFPVIHITSPHSDQIQKELLTGAKQSSLKMRTEKWGDNEITYVALATEKNKDVGLLELTTVLVGDQLTLSITSDVMPMIRKMKVLGMVPDARNLKESETRFSKVIKSTPSDGMHGYLNVVNLGRLITSNPSTTAGVDLNLYFPEIAKDMGFKSEKGACINELDSLLLKVPTLIGRAHVEEYVEGIEISSKVFIEILDPVLADHIHSLNGSLRFIDNSENNLFDVATALNFTDASWKLLGLKNYLESYDGDCPELQSIYKEMLREIEFTEIALMASFVEGVNGANVGVSHFEINKEDPLKSKLQGYASLSTVNLNILRSLAQLAPEEYQGFIPEPGTSSEVNIPDMPPQLGLVMHSSDTELTAMFGTEKGVMNEIPEFNSEPGILALDIDIAAFKPLYEQIPRDSADCKDLMHGYYIADRFADKYSLLVAAKQDGIEIVNSTRVKRPEYSFSSGLNMGKYEFQYIDSQCQWNTFDVVDITRSSPFEVQLAEIRDECSFVDASWNIRIDKGVAIISSKGKYVADCKSEEKNYNYEFDCVIESRVQDELVCSNPKSDSFYRIVRMGSKESAIHQKKIDQHNKDQELKRIKKEQADVLSYVENQEAIQTLEIEQQIAWGELAKSINESVKAGTKTTGEMHNLVEEINGAVEGKTASNYILEIEFIDDCWVEIQNSKGTKIVAELKTAGDSIAIELEGGGQVLLGRSSAVDRFDWQGKSVGLEPYTKKGISRLVLTKDSVKQQPVSKNNTSSRKSENQEEQLVNALAYIQDEIRKRWVRPADARNGMEVELRIFLVPTGEVINIEVTYRKDATSAFVNSVIQAVKKVGRFDELADLDPALFDANFRTFKILFRPEDLRL